MTYRTLTVFLLGAGMGAGVMALAGIGGSSQPGADSGHRVRGPEVVAALPPNPETASSGRVPAAGDADFLTHAASRNFGPGGPVKKDFEEVLFRRPNLARHLAFCNLLAQLTPQNAAAAFEVVGGPEAAAFNLHEEHGMLWDRWGEIDGAAACSSIYQIDSRFEETDFSKRAIKSWASRDPRAAYGWLMAQKDQPLRNGMMRGLLEGYATADPQEAYRFVREELREDTLKDHGYWQVARSLLASDGLPAVQDLFVKFDRTDPHYPVFSRTVADIFTDAHSAEALKWLPTLDSDTQKQLSEYVLNRLVRTQPDRLLRELAATGFPAIEPGSDAVKEETVIRKAVKAWVGSNPDAMGEWLKDNRNLPAYDKFAAPFAEQIRAVDPQSSKAWIETLKDPVMRQKLLDAHQN